MKAGRTRVLVVEDEQDIAGLIKHALEREAAVDVEIAASGDAALKAVTEDVPDLVILDLNLPVLSGVEVCRILRGRPETAKVPIIMLTARSTESDRIAGLDVGADDYITKPFSLRELAARVRAVLRRGAPTASVTARRRSIAASNRRRLRRGRRRRWTARPIRLTRREFELLRYLVANKNRVLVEGSPARTRLGIRPGDRNAFSRRPCRAASRKTPNGGAAD